MVFRVKDLPPPMAFAARRTATDNSVNITDLRAAIGLSARLDDSPFHADYVVKRFKLTVLRTNGQAFAFPVNGNHITPEVHNVLDQVRQNDRVIFEEIRAQLHNGQGPEMDLPAIGLKVLR